MLFRGNINEKSVSAKIQNLRDRLEKDVKNDLRKVAEDLIQRTPVVSGAFAESFSVVPASSGAGRRKSSKGRPKTYDTETFLGIARQNMNSDIDKIELIENRSVSFRNRAPHAAAVEDKHQVFAAVKDIRR